MPNPIRNFNPDSSLSTVLDCVYRVERALEAAETAGIDPSCPNPDDIREATEQALKDSEGDIRVIVRAFRELDTWLAEGNRVPNRWSGRT